MLYNKIVPTNRMCCLCVYLVKMPLKLKLSGGVELQVQVARLRRMTWCGVERVATLRLDLLYFEDKEGERVKAQYMKPLKLQTSSAHVLKGNTGPFRKVCQLLPREQWTEFSNFN